MIGRTYRLLDPWAGFEEIFGDISPWGFSGSSGAGFPALNFYRKGDDGVITAELPGVDAADIDVSVVGRTLTISGERKAPEYAEGEAVYRSERRYGKFKRTVELPYNVEAGSVEANFENGILAVTLPRAEADKPRKIDINLN